MILSRFLKPKWQHADAETRKQTLLEMDSADPTLVELAQQDTDPSVRSTAVQRLVDFGLLQRIAREDTDQAVQTTARERYRALLVSTDTDHPTLDERLEQLRGETDHDLVELLSRRAAEPELRIAALRRIDLETTLTDIAIHDTHPDVRLAALERVHTPALLEQIARQSRNRDKRLYRLARERLDTLLATKTQVEHIERLCREMEELIWDGESGRNAGYFPKLEQEWRQRESTASVDQQERYTRARARFLAERHASAERRSQRLELIGTLENMLEQLRQAMKLTPELDETLQHTINASSATWQQLDSIQSTEDRRTESRFKQLLQQISKQERVLRRDQTYSKRMYETLQQAETLLKQPSEIHNTDIKRLQQHWESLKYPESPARAADLKKRFSSLLDQLRTRLQRQTQQRDQEWQELQDMTQQLEAAIEDGQLQQSTTLHQQARKRLKRNIGLSRAQMATLDERLQACATRIGELQGWRRWGAHQAREQLCTSAEALIDLEADPTDIAQRIQQAREAWKKLDHQEGAAPKHLWKRFNTACEHAYIPCQVYFEAQAKERQKNAEDKTAFCEKLEQYEATTDWQQPDWPEADRLRRRAQEQWYKLGPVNRTDRKPLNRRFQQIIKKLDRHLNVERNKEIQRRQTLIEQLQALVDHPDLRSAIEAAKRAQAQWHPTVKAPPRQEQALWKAFRAACDAIFARRQAELQAIDTEQQSNLQRKLELCSEIEALVATDAEQLPQARTRLQAIRKEVDALGQLPKAEQRATDQRFNAAIHQFAQREQFLDRISAQEDFQNLHAHTRICAQLEALLEHTADTHHADATIEALQKQWDTLATLPAALAEPMQQRFDAICQALGDETRAAKLRAKLEKNLERKQIWCICMEIIAGLESPPEFTQMRMEYQVARLSVSLAGATAKTDALYDPHQLQKQWCLTGALPAEIEAALDTRFLTTTQAWWQQETA